jgi:hypothetical protein
MFNGEHVTLDAVMGLVDVIPEQVVELRAGPPKNIVPPIRVNE